MKKLVIGILVACVAIGCALESKYGLPHDQPIHQELLGKWISLKQRDTITIARANDYTYSIAIKSGNQDQEEFSTTAYISNIKNKAIVTVAPLDAAAKYSFYGIQSVNNDTLVFAEVKNIFLNSEEKDFFSPKELKRYFKKHCDDADFFNQSIVLVRLK